MNIHALTVSVNYSDFLQYSAERWMTGLKTWTIVTDLRDEQTVKLAESVGARVHRTNVFYENGATFNKGAALEEARKACVPWEDWFLLIDADVVPPVDWFTRMGTLFAFLDPETLYGAPRFQCGNLNDIDNLTWPRIPDAICDGGYFQMFHTSDPHIARLDPLIETCWAHAGVYDSHLKNNWSAADRRELPLRLIHLGEQENWWGRGNRAAFKEMNRERIRRGGYQHERIDGK